MKCYESGCGFRGAYRYVKIHWDGEHSNGKQVFAMKCGQNNCEWFCYKTMKCFVYHMKSMHDINTTAKNEMLCTIKIPKNTGNHSPYCNFSASEGTAKRKERVKANRVQKYREKREKRLALLQVKKTVKKVVKKPAKNVRKTKKKQASENEGWNVLNEIVKRSDELDVLIDEMEDVLKTFK